MEGECVITASVTRPLRRKERWNDGSTLRTVPLSRSRSLTGLNLAPSFITRVKCVGGSHSNNFFIWKDFNPILTESYQVRVVVGGRWPVSNSAPFVTYSPLRYLNGRLIGSLSARFGWGIICKTVGTLTTWKWLKLFQNLCRFH